MPINTAPGVQIVDEGVVQGRVQSLNFVGTGVAATVVAGIGVITVTAGGAAGVAGVATVDFGATPTDIGEFSITDAGLVGMTHVEAFFMADDVTAGDSTNDDHSIAGAMIRCVCKKPVGAIMDVVAYVLVGMVKGTFKLHYRGA